MPRVMSSLLLLVLVSLAGCGLFLTGDSENAPGRGPKAFDPYAGAASGAVRLGLQMLNGCGIYATGEPVGRGTANIPYPTDCGRYQYQNPIDPNAPPPRPLQLLAGTTYFLNQLTIHEMGIGLHTDPTNMAAISDWMRTQTRFRDLDWTNLEIVSNEWEPSNESISPYAFTHTVRWANANWMNVTDDTFLLEVLDADGNVRTSQTYSHVDFFAENPIAGHSAAFWENGNIGQPQFPGDLVVHPKPPAPPGYPPPVPPSYRSHVRLDIIGASRTPKTFELDPGLIGDGAIRITWSQLPSQPFYWPVTFVKPADQPPTCFSGSDPSQPTVCGFGLQPTATLSPPMNGKFYQPGENYQLTLGVQDGNGNWLHPLDHFPSWNEYNTNQANGLLYINFFNFYVMRERDTITGFNIAGPRQLMRPYYELASSPYYIKPTEEFVPGDSNEGITPITGPNIAANLTVGARDARQPTTFNMTIPPNAQPGTYSVYWKVNREFLGERFTKLVAFDFQVGQEQVTIIRGASATARSATAASSPSRTCATASSSTTSKAARPATTATPSPIRAAPRGIASTRCTCPRTNIRSRRTTAPSAT